MNSSEILELLKYGEHINLECKKAESNLPKSIWETYSSFANTDGGVILFGVEEHMKEIDIDKRFSFVSIHNPEQRLKDFWNTINGEKVSANILVDANVGTCEIKGATIIWIQVPQADYRLKPVYINGNPMKGSFKRNHEGDYHCTEEEVKAMLRDANESGNDGSLLTGYTMDDIDLNSLRSYRIESVEVGHILSSLVDKNMLIINKKGRWTSYKINTDYEIEPEQLQFSDISSDMIVFKNETDKIIYEYIKANGFITTHQILDITRITTTAGASVALGRLMDIELIEKVRKGRQFIYQLKN